MMDEMIVIDAWTDGDWSYEIRAESDGISLYENNIVWASEPRKSLGRITRQALFARIASLKKERDELREAVGNARGRVEELADLVRSFDTWMTRTALSLVKEVK